MSPMADYYSAFAPSAFVNRVLVDYPNTAPAVSQQGQGVVAMPAANADANPDGRVARTTADINAYYQVLKNLSGQDKPYWPRSILIEPEEKGKTENLAGKFLPDREVIELYSSQGAGYSEPYLKHIDKVYSSLGDTDNTLPHELSHFIDYTYSPAASSNRSIPQPKVGEMPFVLDPYEHDEGEVNPAVLLNEMQPTGVTASGAIAEPYMFRRPMAAGTPAKGASESEIYADQLGKALQLWKNSAIHPEGYQYNIPPVTLQDMERYNAVAEKSPMLQLGRKIMSPEAITPDDLRNAYSQLAANSVGVVLPPDEGGVSQSEGVKRQDEIARTILMELALNRLQAGTNSEARNQVPAVRRAVMDPVTWQMLPLGSIQNRQSNQKK